MRELNIQEVHQVSGGDLTMTGALNIIGGIAAVAAIVPGGQPIAGFAAGVFLIGTILMETA